MDLDVRLRPVGDTTGPELAALADGLSRLLATGIGGLARRTIAAARG